MLVDDKKGDKMDYASLISTILGAMNKGKSSGNKSQSYSPGKTDGSQYTNNPLMGNGMDPSEERKILMMQQLMARYMGNSGLKNQSILGR